MKKSICLAILLAICITSCALVFAVDFSVNADGEYERKLSQTGITVTVGNTTISDVYSDPVNYYEDAAAGSLNAQEIRYQTVLESDSVIYTAWYPKTTTGRTGNVVEYVCELDGSNYVVKSINTSGDGATYIPVGGFVLSVNATSHANIASIGDTISFDKNLHIPTKAVESESGKRIVVDNTNTTRSAPMVVYYDYQFGEKTGTNVFGTEMTCEYDFENNTFKVTSFRGFGTGDDSGSVIPDNSFVLSAYGEGYRGLLVRNELFSIGDSVKMVGFDFIRFGGTVVGTYDYVNPTREGNPYSMEFPNQPFPAYRGTDQTMIYKHGWSYEGSEGTGTNVYGYEAAVDAEGVVVELNVNVSKIPEGGYVISGHGKGRDFIRSNMVLGATVVLDETNKTYSISTTLNSYYENLVTSVNVAVESAQNAIKRLYDVDEEAINALVTQVTNKLAELKTVKEGIEASLESGGITETQRLSLLMNYNNYQIQIEKLKNQIVILSAESKGVSARAVWHRPIEMSYSAIEENIKMYRDIGMNLIFVETWYNGVSAFKSDCVDFPYNTKLSDKYTKADGTVYNDYLSAFVACAKEYGIETHAWVENFYVGTLESATIIQNHPDWIMYNDDGTIFQRNEGGLYIFIDPTNKDVQDALINYYLDLFEKVPDVAGLNLDYIRYPVSDADEDTGYTIAAMKAFGEMKGVEFSEVQLANRDKMANKFKQLFNKDYLIGGQKEAEQNYTDWVNFRMGVVTDYVKRIKTEIKDEKGIILSTSVFSSVIESKQNKKQDWQTWFRNGWIDISTPMAYYTDATDVLKNVQDMILFAGNNCYYYTGLASSYSGLPAWKNKEQIEASYSAGANGYVIFCSTQIIGHTDVQNALSSGVNSITNAVLPHASVQKVTKGYFDTIIDRANRIYIPNNGMTEAQRDSLKAKFDEIVQMPATNAVEIYKIQQKIVELYSPSITTYAKGYSGQRITEQLKELVELLSNKISMQLIADGEWDPEENQTPPTVDESGVYYPSDKPIDPPPVNPVNPEPQKPSTQQPTTEQPEKGNNALVIILICVGGAVLVGGGVAALIIIKRKKQGK